MATTPVFNWPTPNDTDLVRNGAAAIRDLGDAIDTTVSEIDVATTKGDLLVYDGTDYQRLPVGADEEVLVADSTEATGVKWDEAPSGSLTLIASGTLSGSSVSITSIPAGFDHLYLNIEVVRASHTTTTALLLRINGDTGNNYAWSKNTNAGAPTQNNYAQSNIGNMIVQNTGSGDGSANLNASFYHYRKPKRHVIVRATGFTTVPNAEFYSGVHDGSGALTSIQMTLSGGTYVAGDYFLYGVN
jgi:hypothetical protein